MVIETVLLTSVQEFKLTTIREVANGGISAEVKNTTCIPLGIGKMRKLNGKNLEKFF